MRGVVGNPRVQWHNEKSLVQQGAERGFLKPGDTYFHAGMHYHRLRKLNCCVRDGNRCDLSDMVAGRPDAEFFADIRPVVW